MVLLNPFVKCIKYNLIGGISGEFVDITQIKKSEWRKISSSKKKELSPYRCTNPKCNEPMRPKMGQQIQHHFAHFGKNNCNGESQEHILSKIAIKEYLHKIQFKICQGWYGWKEKNVFEWVDCAHNISYNSGEICEIEYTLKCKNTCKYLDVGILKNNKPICSIEVIKTCPTTEHKKDILKEKNIRLIEVDAEEVLSKIYKTLDIESIIFNKIKNTDAGIIIEVINVNQKQCEKCSNSHTKIQEKYQQWRAIEKRKT